jgi:hypothetical protein
MYLLDATKGVLFRICVSVQLLQAILSISTIETALSSCKLWQTLHHHTGDRYILKKNTYRKKPHLASSQGRKIELHFLSDTKLKPTKICGQVATQFYMGVKERMISIKRQMRENPKKRQSWNILAGITAASSLHTVFALQESKE